MTDQRKPCRRRRHPAAAGRILAAGVSASVTIGLSGVIAQAAREADAASGRQGALQPPAPAQPPRPIVVQVVPQPASPGLVAPSLSLPPTTLPGSRPRASATTGAGVARVSRTTRATVVALPARTSASPPPTRPAPVTTSSGSKP